MSLQQLSEIFQHSASHREEVCGILVGRRQPQFEITGVIRGRNVHPVPARHFLLDAASLLRADALSARSESEIVGFYHSHPNGSGLPSRQDRRDAWPSMLLLIVAVVDDTPRYLCGWRLDGERRLLSEPIMQT